MRRKILSLLLCLGFLLQQTGFAEVIPTLDIAGHLRSMHSSFISDKFRPLQLRYFSYDTLSDNFKLLFDKGDTDRDGPLKKGLIREPSLSFEKEAHTLLKYFLIGISLPDKSFWVNLRPDSEDQLIDDDLAKTDIGKILLETDLQLKKDTAKFTSPETPEGREYWDKLYKKAGELFGSENITIPTLTRPWIVPGEIIIRETEDSAFIYKATLKVMLEEDYLNTSSLRGAEGDEAISKTGLLRSARNDITNYKQYEFKDPRLKELNQYSTQLIKELIIPKLTKEVNIAKRYAQLRQVYSSLILSRWFKARFKGLSPQTGTGHFPSELKQGSAKESVPPIKGTVPFYVGLIDSKNLNGLTSKDSWSKTTYFKDYQKSFNNGEYNLKEPVYTPTGQVIRSYFSGGATFGEDEIVLTGYKVEGGDGLVLGGLARAIGPLLQGQPLKGNPLPELKPVTAASPLNSNAVTPSQIAKAIDDAEHMIKYMQGRHWAALEALESVVKLLNSVRPIVESGRWSQPAFAQTEAKIDALIAQYLSVVGRRDSYTEPLYMYAEILRSRLFNSPDKVQQAAYQVIYAIKTYGFPNIFLTPNSGRMLVGNGDFGTGTTPSIEIFRSDTINEPFEVSATGKVVYINEKKLNLALQSVTDDDERMKIAKSIVIEALAKALGFQVGFTAEESRRAGELAKESYLANLSTAASSPLTTREEQEFNLYLEKGIITVADKGGYHVNLNWPENPQRYGPLFHSYKKPALRDARLAAIFSPLDFPLKRINFEDFGQLYKYLRALRKAQGAESIFPAEDIIRIIEEMRYIEEPTEEDFAKITGDSNTPAEGLKDAVRELLQKERGRVSSLDQTEDPRASSPMEEAIPTDEMRDKLQHLEVYYPEAHEIVWDFGKFLSGRLRPEVTPSGFFNAALYAIYDLDSDFDRFTRKPISDRNLVGKSPIYYLMLLANIPKIGELVTPSDFAKRVREIEDKAKKRISSQEDDVRSPMSWQDDLGEAPASLRLLKIQKTWASQPGQVESTLG